MADDFLKTDPESDDQELIVESKRAINYLQVQRNYRYVEFLAQGGYGWVSLVYDDTEKRPLAVKCTTDTSDMELTWWPKLQHDAILPLIEYITLDSCTVFVMPAMRKDLWMCVTEPQFYQDELSFGLSRIWLKDVATALDYLHNQHLCHLDLKLDNVFLKDNGRACLGDFSLLSDSREVPAHFHFLELYEPPEYTDWCHGKPPSGITDAAQFGGDKADMWQYGILALDLLTNLSLSGKSSNYFTLWHHDVWPFLQKILLHKEYLEYLMEDAFQNVFFNDLDFELCHEFLESVLIIEPNARASAAEVMKHEFVNVEWPQIPASFGMPRTITAHLSKPRPKEMHIKQLAEDAEEGVPLDESPSKLAADVLKKKMEKIQKEKQGRRQTMANIAGKSTLNIRHNISGMNVEADRSTSSEFSMNDVEVRGNVMIKKSVDTNNRNNAGSRSNTKKVVTTIAPHKKLQAKVNRDSAGSTSSQLGRSSRSSSKQVTRFLSSSDRNLKSKSPAKKKSEPRGKSSSPTANRSASNKKSPGDRKNSPTSKKSPSALKKSPRDDKSATNRKQSKSPMGRKVSTSAKNSPSNRKSSNNPGDQEKNRNSPKNRDNPTKPTTSPKNPKNTTKGQNSPNDTTSIGSPGDRKKPTSPRNEANISKDETSKDQKNTTKINSPGDRKKPTSPRNEANTSKNETSSDQKNTTKTNSPGDRKKPTSPRNEANTSKDETSEKDQKNTTNISSSGNRQKSMSPTKEGNSPKAKPTPGDQKNTTRVRSLEGRSHSLSHSNENSNLQRRMFVNKKSASSSRDLERGWNSPKARDSSTKRLGSKEDNLIHGKVIPDDPNPRKSISSDKKSAGSLKDLERGWNSPISQNSLTKSLGDRRYSGASNSTGANYKTNTFPDKQEGHRSSRHDCSHQNVTPRKSDI